MQERRKNYFIDKKFQASFILKFCILVIIGTVISGLILYLQGMSTQTTTFENSRLVIKSTADFIMPGILFSSAIVIILIGLATIAVTLFTSHRIAGPLYHLQKEINEIASGDLSVKINLRKKDEIKMLADSLNTMVEKLRNDITVLKDSVSEAQSALGANDIDKTKRVLKKLDELTAKFKTV